ncbi:unnamed protein product, partial [Brachionus calyciflorus]
MSSFQDDTQKRSSSTYAMHKNTFRSATAYEATPQNRSTLSANYKIRNKFIGSNLVLNRAIRSKSAINFIKRPQSRMITSKNPEDAYLFNDDDEKPSRSFMTLARIGMVYFGIEVLFSLEIALTVPILLKLKVPEEYIFSNLKIILLKISNFY